VDDEYKIRISKLEAAKRQLDCAIELWFQEKDEVSVHTLLTASYGVIRDVNRHRRTMFETLEETAFIKDEYQKDWVNLIRKPANFFKHATKDPDGEIEFAPITNVLYMLHAIKGLGELNELSSPLLRIVSIWFFIHDSRYLTAKGLESLKNKITVEQASELRPLTKKQFFEVMHAASVNFHLQQG